MIDAARKTGTTTEGHSVALLRNVHVTTTLASECEEFPISSGEYAVVEYDDGEIVSCSVFDSLVAAEASFGSASSD